MPQLNFYTFLSQTTWTILLFFVLFFFMKQYFLPLIYENLHIKRTLANSKGKSINMHPVSKASLYDTLL